MTEISLIAQNVINFVNQTQKSIFLTGKASSLATTTNGKNTYNYKYDRQNRITDADFAGANALGITTKMYNGSTSYDANGNIQYMSRAVGGVNKDILNYTYTNGNQLGNVTDAGDITSLFKGKAGGAGYTYDANGNMTADGNKDLTINYNYLNLPGAITRTAGATGYVKNYYAGATKIRSVTYTAATNKTKTYDYMAGMVYAQEDALAPKTLDFVATPEGRAMSTKTLLGLSAEPLTGDKFRYEYNLKDHLGNLRVSCRCDEIKRDANGLPYPETDANYGFIPLKAIQEIAYDPWGLNFGNTTDNQKPSTLTDRYQYNGKEKLLDLDLGWSDYGARMYMNEIGRWNGVDLLAERYVSYSTYNYVFNSPLVFKDPNGMSVTSFLNDIWNQSASNSTWNNDGDGTFSNGKGKKVKSEDHVIDFFKDTEKDNSSFKQTIANWQTGDKENIFYLFGHGNSRKIIYGDKEIYSAEDLNRYLAKESPAWKKAIQEGRKVTLIIFACNTGSYSFMQEHSDNPAQNNILKINSMPFGLKVSKSEIFENVTIIAPQAYVNFSKENPGKISSFTNTGGDPNMHIFFRGELISTLQQR